MDRCLVCRDLPTDQCHITSRGAGGSDEDWNLMPLCRRHHIEQHTIGIVSFVTKHESVYKYVTDRNWLIVWDLDRRKLRHAKT